MLHDDTGDLLAAHEYPATTDDIVEAYGDHAIQLPNGTETVGEALSRLGTETFESSREARVALYSAVSDTAVGRVGYSDRDPTPPGSKYAPEPLSF